MPQASVNPYESPRSRGTEVFARAASKLSDGTLRRTLVSLTDQAIFSGTSFLTGVVIARGCSLRELGTYYLILSVIYVMRGVQAEMVSAPYTIFRCRRKGSELDLYTGSILAHQAVVLGVAVLCVLAMFGAATVGWLSPGVGAVAPMLLIAVPFILCRDFIRQFCFAELRYDRALILDGCVLVVQLGCLGLLLFQQQLSVTSAYGIIAAACSLAVAGWWALNRPPAKFRWANIRADWFTNWGFARWALASQLVCSCTPYVMVWLVAWLRDEEVTGLLAACVSLIGLSAMFVTGVASVLTPTAARAYVDEGVDGLKRVIRFTGILLAAPLAAFCVGVWFCGDWMMTTVYGPQFAAGGIVCFVLALNILINGLAIVMGNAFWALNRPRANLPADVVLSVLTLGAAFALVPTMGALGAALAILIGNVGGSILRGVMLRHHLTRMDG
jgi:O-antigen/teichoic acid export membrane protein